MGGINSINKFGDNIVNPVNSCKGIQDNKQNQTSGLFEQLLYENVRNLNQNNHQHMKEKEDEKKDQQESKQDLSKINLQASFAMMDYLISSSKRKEEKKK